jgi:hypothetical protein
VILMLYSQTGTDGHEQIFYLYGNSSQSLLEYYGPFINDGPRPMFRRPFTCVSSGTAYTVIVVVRLRNLWYFSVRAILTFGYLWGHGLRENDRAIVRCKVSQGIERTGDGEHERVDYQKPDFIFRRPMHLGLNVLSSIFPTAAFVGTGDTNGAENALRVCLKE